MVYNKLIFNKQVYAVSVILLNKHGLTPIQPNRILSFSLTEELYSIFPSGKLAIDNTGNLLDQTPAVNGESASKRETNHAPTYAFNTDNRDMVVVDIFPTTDDWFSKDNEAIFPDNVHRLYYEFYIVDEEEELDPDTGKGKVKLFHLKDVREQTLEETKVSWSSANALAGIVGRNINFTQVSNELRSPYTGEAIKHFIKAALPITNTFNDWDRGATTIFHSSLPCHTSYDTLEVLLDSHISQAENDNCILGLERSSRGAGDWFLRPLTKFYSNAVDTIEDTLGKYTYDIFHVSSSSQGGSVTRPPDNIPMRGFAAVAQNEVIQKFDGLDNFTFLNMPNGLCMSEIASTITHGYNFGEKQFDIDCEETHIGRIRDKFNNLYVKHMLGDPPTPIFPIEGDRLENKIVNHVYSSGSTPLKRKKGGLNRVLSKALAFAPGISFATPGTTHRQPGRFVIIVDSTIEPDSAFEKVLNGEWFMTKVVHHFNFSILKYNQQIACTKSHAYTNLATLNSDDVAVMLS